jgi:hypothetical protein
MEVEYWTREGILSYRVKGPKSVRFSEIVKACGQPEPVTPWLDPAKDKRFMTAVRQNRVMTVEQDNVGTHRDIGIFGFIKERNVSYFIFPKTLSRFVGKEVKGIKYELIKQPAATESEPARESRLATHQPKKQVEKRYCVTVRWTAVMNTSHEVQAKDPKAARKKVFESDSVPDLSQSQVSRKVLGVEEL